MFSEGSAGLTESLARRAVERSTARRREDYEREVQRIIDATYRVIERTGSISPSMREVLGEAGLSTQAFYRYFRSKDELLLVLLDDGRRRLVGYLRHRMALAGTPPDKVRAWIEGVMAQAMDPDAAARTRPFAANQDRLAELFPEEQQASVDVLLELLVDTIAEQPGGGPADPVSSGDGPGTDVARLHATAVYQLTFGTLHDCLARRRTPSAAEVDHLVRFAQRGLGWSGSTRAG